MAGVITQVTDSNFQAEVLESETAVLVDFWAPWCGPCRAVTPILEQLADAQAGIEFTKVNIDDNPGYASRYGVLSIPTLILFKNGEPATRIIGALPKKRLVQELEPTLAA